MKKVLCEVSMEPDEDRFHFRFYTDDIVQLRDLLQNVISSFPCEKCSHCGDCCTCS